MLEISFMTLELLFAAVWLLIRLVVSLLAISDKFRAEDLAIIAKSFVYNLTRLPIHFSLSDNVLCVIRQRG